MHRNTKIIFLGKAIENHDIFHKIFTYRYTYIYSIGPILSLNIF